MRIAALTMLASAAVFAAAIPAQAQKVPMWRLAQDQQFIIPKCVAPAKLVETRSANGRIVWRCVAPK